MESSFYGERQSSCGARDSELITGPLAVASTGLLCLLISSPPLWVIESLAIPNLGVRLHATKPIVSSNRQPTTIRGMRIAFFMVLSNVKALPQGQGSWLRMNVRNRRIRTRMSGGVEPVAGSRSQPRGPDSAITICGTSSLRSVPCIGKHLRFHLEEHSQLERIFGDKLRSLAD